MSGVKHTPGPWASLGSFVITEAEVSINRTHGYGCRNDFICDLNDGEYHEYTSQAEQEANARLIAAAPDLLEAAEEFCRRVEAGEIRSKRSYAAFKAAIARARGEQSPNHSDQKEVVMADTPRVTVPVEPTEAMIEAAESAGMSMAGSDMPSPDMTRHVWSAMLSAAPGGGVAEALREALIQADLKIRSLPGTDQSDVEFIREALATREEAPAEAGNLVADLTVLSACDDMEVSHSGGDTNVGDVARRCLSHLRAQPPAREDAQPVASAYRVRPEMNDPEEWTLMHPERAFDYLDRPGWETQPLYTHPAPDALRVAVEALEVSRENIIGWFEAIDAETRVEHEMHVSLKDDLAVIDQALAALQAEQKGGA